MMRLFYIVLFLFCITAYADSKYLQFDFNSIVTISIFNDKCPMKNLVANYPYVAIAVKYTDKEHTKVADIMRACYTHREDTIVIQWEGGDKSEFPANYFLVKGSI